VSPSSESPQSYGARSDWRDSEWLLKAVMGNDEAFKSVMAAQQALSQQQLDHTAAAVQNSVPGTHRARALIEWNGTISDNALLWGATMDAANLAHIEGGQAADARTQALQQLAAAATSTIPVPGGTAIEFLFSQARDHAFSQPLSHHEADKRLDANYNIRLTEHLVRDLAVTSAANHHLLDTGAALANYHPDQPTDSAHDFQRPDGTILPRDQMTLHQQDAYSEWLRSYFMGQQNDISLNIRKGIEGYS
jgi:hypothetical protein